MAQKGRRRCNNRRIGSQRRTSPTSFPKPPGGTHARLRARCLRTKVDIVLSIPRLGLAHPICAQEFPTCARAKNHPANLRRLPNIPIQHQRSFTIPRSFSPNRTKVGESTIEHRKESVRIKRKHDRIYNKLRFVIGSIDGCINLMFKLSRTFDTANAHRHYFRKRAHSSVYTPKDSLSAMYAFPNSAQCSPLLLSEWRAPSIRCNSECRYKLSFSLSLEVQFLHSQRQVIVSFVKKCVHRQVPFSIWPHHVTHRHQEVQGDPPLPDASCMSFKASKNIFKSCLRRSGSLTFDLEPRLLSSKCEHLCFP